MRILHWDEMFHPNFGYQINVLPVYQKKQGHEVTIMTAEHPENHPTFASFANSKDNIKELDQKFMDETGVKIIRLPIIGVYSGRVIYKPGFIKRINEEKPDVVMCHTSDTLSAMQIIIAHNRVKAPLVFDNHMLEMASNNKLSKYFRLFYKRIVTPIIVKNRFITIRTQNDDYVNRCLGIPSELTPFISFGTDTELFKPNSEKKEEYRKILGIPNDAFVIVYAGKIEKAKGGLILANALKERFNSRKDLYAIIISNKNDDEYSNKVEEVFSKSSNTIIRIGTQPYRELAKYYICGDLAIFARQCSLSFFDVQSSGLPVILEDNNVNIERVSHGNGFVFTSGDSDDLRAQIEKCLSMDNEDYELLRQSSRKTILDNFDYTTIANEYTNILNEERIRQSQRRKRK